VLLVLPKLLDFIVSRLGNAALHGITTTPSNPQGFFSIRSANFYSFFVIVECEKLLEGYFAFHHLMIQFVLEFPELAVEASKKVAEFIANPSQRHIDV